MDSERIRHPEIFSQALKLTLGVWIFTFLLFLIPVLAAEGRLPQFAIGITALDIAFGMALSAPLYWAAARLHEAPVALKVGGVFAAVCAVAFAFALFDAATGGQLIRIFMRSIISRPTSSTAPSRTSSASPGSTAGWEPSTRS